MSYPKIFTHRDNHTAQVVIANAEQEAQLPAEYLPVGAELGASFSDGLNADSVLLSNEYSTMLEQKEILERARLDFAEEVATTRRQLAHDREQIDADRATLTAGYKESMAQLDADRATLDDNRANLRKEIEAWHESKTSEQPPDQDAATQGDAAAPADAAPSKRTRTPKG